MEVEQAEMAIENVPIETMKRETHNYDGKEDRLGDLPECVLLHILSFLTAKEVVQICILSTRWKNLWKHLPMFRICSSYFKTMDGFTEFITKFLSLRDDSTALYDIKFTRNGMVEPDLLERMLKYAVSHNVKWMLLIILNYNIEHIPSCIFSCHTLTSLNLAVSYHNGILFPNSLNLPALTSLSLGNFVFCSDDDGRAEPFSALKKLDSLTIWFCQVLNAPNLCISNVTLASLTIQTHQWSNYRKIELSTPSLSKFAYAGTLFEKLCGSHLCSIKHLNIDAYMHSNNAEPPSNLFSWLRALTEIKSLTVTSTTLQVLSLYPNLLNVKFHSLRNLKSLRVKMEGISSGSSKTPVDGIFVKLPVTCQEEVAEFREAIFKEGFPAILDEMVRFLLQNSQSAKVHIIN